MYYSLLLLYNFPIIIIVQLLNSTLLYILVFVTSFGTIGEDKNLQAYKTFGMSKAAFFPRF